MCVCRCVHALGRDGTWGVCVLEASLSPPPHSSPTHLGRWRGCGEAAAAPGAAGSCSPGDLGAQAPDPHPHWVPCDSSQTPRGILSARTESTG